MLKEKGLNNSQIDIILSLNFLKLSIEEKLTHNYYMFGIQIEILIRITDQKYGHNCLRDTKVATFLSHMCLKTTTI